MQQWASYFALSFSLSLSLSLCFLRWLCLCCCCYRYLFCFSRLVDKWPGIKFDVGNNTEATVTRFFFPGREREEEILYLELFLSWHDSFWGSLFLSFPRFMFSDFVFERSNRMIDASLSNTYRGYTKVSTFTVCRGTICLPRFFSLLLLLLLTVPTWFLKVNVLSPFGIFRLSIFAWVSSLNMFR